jgi:hypothetical protein
MCSGGARGDRSGSLVVADLEAEAGGTRRRFSSALLHCQLSIGRPWGGETYVPLAMGKVAVLRLSSYLAPLWAAAGPTSNAEVKTCFRPRQILVFRSLGGFHRALKSGAANAQRQETDRVHNADWDREDIVRKPRPAS